MPELWRVPLRRFDHVYTPQPVLNLEKHIHRSPYLFGTEQLTIKNMLADIKLLAHTSAEQMAENDQKQMPMDALPRAAFKVIQSQHFLGFAETILHRPPPKGNTKDLS